MLETPTHKAQTHDKRAMRRKRGTGVGAVRTFRAQDEAETRRLAAALGALLRPGHLLFLGGSLGAGKTVFTQGLAVGLGIKERVTSPTFTLVHHYGPAGTGGADSDSGPSLVHADLYRLEDAGEVEGLGLEEAIGEVPVVVEWWERAPDMFPAGRLEICITPLGDAAGSQRRLDVHATDERHSELLAAWVQALGGETNTPARN